MQYNEKLRLYFKKIGVSQSEVGKRLGHAPAMMSRFLSGTSILDANFILALVREFPDIDLKYIFSDEDANSSMVQEPREKYATKDVNVIKELELIEKKLSNIRKVLAQSCHKK